VKPQRRAMLKVDKLTGEGGDIKDRRRLISPSNGATPKSIGGGGGGGGGRGGVGGGGGGGVGGGVGGGGGGGVFEVLSCGVFFFWFFGGWGLCVGGGCVCLCPWGGVCFARPPPSNSAFFFFCPLTTTPNTLGSPSTHHGPHKSSKEQILATPPTNPLASPSNTQGHEANPGSQNGKKRGLWHLGEYLHVLPVSSKDNKEQACPKDRGGENKGVYPFAPQGTISGILGGRREGPPPRKNREERCRITSDLSWGRVKTRDRVEKSRRKEGGKRNADCHGKKTRTARQYIENPAVRALTTKGRRGSKQRGMGRRTMQTSSQLPRKGS